MSIVIFIELTEEFRVDINTNQPFSNIKEEAHIWSSTPKQGIDVYRSACTRLFKYFHKITKTSALFVLDINMYVISI